MKYQGLIFDMDGVLVDSELLHVEAEQKTCADHNILAPQLAWESFRGKTSHDVFASLVTAYGNPETHNIANLTDYKTSIYISLAEQKLNLHHGAMECLYEARVNFRKVGLATSSNHAIQEMVFHKFNLYPYFDAIVTGDDVRNGKPHPEPYITAAAKLRLTPEQCMVIEDSDNGIVSAKQAGAYVIGITTSLPRKTLITAGADHVVKGFEELQDLIVRIQSA